ncbi:glycosyltransferase, partial [Verrucomicrobiota bacterium]
DVECSMFKRQKRRELQIFMKTSVLIAVYNRPDMLKACLRALALTGARFDEVVVSDDGSSEEFVRRMQAFFPEFSFPIRYVSQEDKGFRAAAARNNAIRKSEGDYLICLDCDILLLPGALDIHLRHARQGSFLAADRAFLNEASSRKAIEGPLDADLLEDLWQGADRNHLGRVQRQFERNRLLRKLGLTRRHKPKILGCHFSLFREDVERINGFDEHYVGWGLEDDDFCMRLHQAGVRGKSIIPEARALHLRHESVDSRPRKFSESRNLSYFNRRNVPTYCVQGLVQGE